MFRLALALGKTVAELLDDLGEGEFAAWQEFYLVEPFGSEWRQTSRICQTVANYAGRTLKNSASEDEWMPVKPKADKPLPPEQIFRQWRLALSALGKTPKPAT